MKPGRTWVVRLPKVYRPEKKASHLLGDLVPDGTRNLIKTLQMQFAQLSNLVLFAI
jgi:hypothetical protein